MFNLGLATESGGSVEGTCYLHGIALSETRTLRQLTRRLSSSRSIHPERAGKLANRIPGEENEKLSLLISPLS